MDELDFISGPLDTPAAREKPREIVREELARAQMAISPDEEELMTTREVAR